MSAIPFEGFSVFTYFYSAKCCFRNYLGSKAANSYESAVAGFAINIAALSLSIYLHVICNCFQARATLKMYKCYSYSFDVSILKIDLFKNLLPYVTGICLLTIYINTLFPCQDQWWIGGIYLDKILSKGFCLFVLRKAIQKSQWCMLQILRFPSTLFQLGLCSFI